MHRPPRVSLADASARVRITANSRGVNVATQRTCCCRDTLCADPGLPAWLRRRGLRQQRFACRLRAELQSARDTRNGQGDCPSQSVCLTVSGGLQLRTLSPPVLEPANVGPTLSDRAGFVSDLSSNQMQVFWHASCLRSALGARSSLEQARPTREEQPLALMPRTCGATSKVLERSSSLLAALVWRLKAMEAQCTSPALALVASAVRISAGRGGREADTKEPW